MISRLWIWIMSSDYNWSTLRFGCFLGSLNLLSFARTIPTTVFLTVPLKYHKGPTELSCPLLNSQVFPHVGQISTSWCLPTCVVPSHIVPGLVHGTNAIWQEWDMSLLIIALKTMQLPSWRLSLAGAFSLLDISLGEGWEGWGSKPPCCCELPCGEAHVARNWSLQLITKEELRPVNNQSKFQNGFFNHNRLLRWLQPWLVACLQLHGEPVSEPPK